MKSTASHKNQSASALAFSFYWISTGCMHQITTYMKTKIQNTKYHLLLFIVVIQKYHQLSTASSMQRIQLQLVAFFNISPIPLQAYLCPPCLLLVMSTFTLHTGGGALAYSNATYRAIYLRCKRGTVLTSKHDTHRTRFYSLLVPPGMVLRPRPSPHTRETTTTTSTLTR